ncbi:hypothetical protein [uncultured Aquimarina sp.]|uniref:hypothetical protein n=1 Tax=uncultured Aquimarina sp. TaxID=575652 RepID=UPI002635EB21|nr:hypothetical protein [uncultured Aquimarina sp.]
MIRQINVEFVRKYLFSLLLIVSVLLFFIIHLFFTIKFESNDDVVMALISSGAYSGDIDNHLVFINMLYGSLLNLFYYLIPAYEWYPISFVIINILSVTLISWTILRTTNNKLEKLIFLLFLLLVFLEITVQLQFTKTAAIAAVSGVILLKETKGKMLYGGMSLIILASIIRFEATLLVLLIVMPIFFLDFFKDRKFRFNFRIKVLLVTVMISFVCKAIDYVYYAQDAEWEYFSKYNKLRGKINDNPNARSVFNNLPEGIAPADYDALLSFFPNPDTMDYEAVKKINLELNKVPPFTKIRYIFSLHYYLLPILLLAFIVIAARYNKEKNSPSNIGIAWMFGLLMGALIYVSLNGAVKNRVFFVAFVSFILVLPYLLVNFSSSIQKKIILISVLVSTYYFYNNIQDTLKNENYAFQVKQNQSKIVAEYLKDESKKLVPYSGNYRLEYLNPFRVSVSFYTDRIYLGGWFTNIPFHKDRFQSFDDLIDNYGVLVDKRYYKLAVWQITNSILENNNIKVEPKVVLNYNGNYIIEFNRIQN